ncbi:MAG: cysteine desulfurase family protein [Calditrichaceae bacterium]
MKPVYLDYNATTPIDPVVAEAMRPFLSDYFGNPSSSHFYGRQTKSTVENARNQVAGTLDCLPEEIIFTSGGTESNNYALKGAAFANRDKGNHIITSQIEHPAIIEVCRYLEKHNFKITYLPVDSDGLIDPDLIAAAITPQTILISIMHANNEVGSIQPIKEIAEMCHKNDIIIHSDCAQSIGKIPVNIKDLKVDMLSAAGHKLYAPKGIGALYVRSGIRLEKLMHGAGHENDMRAGTENILEISGLGKAFELINNDSKSSTAHLKNMRDYLENEILKRFPFSRVNGHKTKRLPNTSSIGFKGLEANRIVDGLSETVAVSAGAACHSSTVKISSVLKAMQAPMEYAMGTVRFSVGRFTTKEEIDRALNELEQVIYQLKNELN